MKICNFNFNDENLKEKCKEILMCNYSDILVQIFSGINDENKIEKIVNKIKELIPKCKIIGTTTGGEFLDFEILEREVVISVSCFEKSTINLIHIESDSRDVSFQNIIKENITPRSKMGFVFNSSQWDKSKAIISYINDEYPHIKLCGGVAGNYEFNEKTMIFSEYGIMKFGTIIALIDSDELYIQNSIFTNWITLGKEYTITKSDGCIINTIDNMVAEEFIFNHLERENNQNILKLGCKYPFMIKRENEYKTNPFKQILQDGSVEVLNEVYTGDKIKFGYPNIPKILEGINRAIEINQNHPAEGVYIYSCVARRLVIQHLIDKNIIKNKVQSAGFNAYGEIGYKDGENTLFYESCSILILSENEESRIKHKGDIIDTKIIQEKIDKSLFKLINNSNVVLDNMNSELELLVKEKTKELEESYMRHYLTGVYNRNKLINDIEDAKHQGAIAVIDIDNFADINDLYGNHNGDEVLKRFALFLKSQIYSTGWNVYNVGSDVFALFSPRLDRTKEEFFQRIKRLQEQIHSYEFNTERYSIYIQTTASVVVEEDRLLEKADCTLNRAKKNQKDILMYSEELRIFEEMEENLFWVNRIKKAIIEDRIVPFFQPIIDNETGEIKKYEALARMKEVDGRIVSPGIFIPISQRAGLYREISRKIIKKTFAKIKECDAELSVNITMTDIMDKETRGIIIENLKKTKGRIVFELVESEGIVSYNDVCEFINEVKVYDAKIAIDDFGTGYSNFMYLTKLNIDYLKIDGSIIKNIVSDPNSRMVLNMIVNYSKNLKIKTIAEFVSDESIYEEVKRAGVDYSQGYYFSKPVENI